VKVFYLYMLSYVLQQSNDGLIHVTFHIEGARAALSLGGTMLGFYPVRVLPSKTAILPVNPRFLPTVSCFMFHPLPYILY
jgi:hypothetical protein